MTSPISYTEADISAIVAVLDADSYKTVMQACCEAGIADKYGTIKRALSRFRKGELGDASATLIAPLALVVEKQCAGILQDANTLSLDGKFTNWQQWWLEKKNPTEYRNKTATEITGEDGGDVKLSLSGLGHEKLIELMLQSGEKVEGSE